MEEMRKAYPMGDMVMYERKPSPLAGKTVVITGKLWRFTSWGYCQADGHQESGLPGQRREARRQAGQGHCPGDSHLVGAGVSHHASHIKGGGAFQ